jgi:hypothetical protein
VNPDKRREARAWLTNAEGEWIDWSDPRQVHTKVFADWDESWQKERQPTDYIESRALVWVRELEKIGLVALRQGDYDLAAKVRLALLKFSSVNRQRIDMTAQIAMTSGPDVSSLSDDELRAIELGSNEQLNELAMRIGAFRPKSREPIQ